jgi:hypothetical protein
MEKLIFEFDLDANIFFESRKNKDEYLVLEIAKLFHGMPATHKRALVDLLRSSITIIEHFDEDVDNSVLD